MLDRKLLKSQAWKDLTHTEKIAYIYLKCAYTGDNNGHLHLTKEEMSGILSKNAFYSAIKGLVEKEWVSYVQKGGLLKQPNIYRLTEKFDALLKR